MRAAGSWVRYTGVGDRAGCDGDYAVENSIAIGSWRKTLAGESVALQLVVSSLNLPVFAKLRWGNQNVLVKFSAREERRFTERWSIYLDCRVHRISRTFCRQHQRQQPRLFAAKGGQVFLESIHRLCTGIRGRRQIVSTEALQGEWHIFARASGR